MSKKKIENMKTVAIIVLLLVVVFGGSYFASELKGCKGDENSVSLANEVSLSEISIDDYLALKKGADKSIIYIARPTCYYCQQQEPIMKEIVSSYDVVVHYLNTDELDQDGLDKLLNSDEYFSGDWGTPLTLIVQNDEIVDMAAGLTTKENMISLLQEHGFIS